MLIAPESTKGGTVRIWNLVAASLLAALAASVSPALAEDRLRLDGKVDGRPARFALDTGLSLPLAAFPDGAARLGLTPVAPPPAEPGAADLLHGLSAPRRVELPPDNIEPNAVFALLKETPQGFEADFDALIGWAGMRENVLYYAPARGAARLQQSLRIDFSKGQAFSLLDSNVAVLDAGQPGAPLPVMIDTGSNAGVELSTPLWNAWRAANPGLPTTLLSHYSPATGAQVRPQAFAGTLRIGGLTLHNVLVSEMPAVGHYGDTPPTAILGLDVFANQDLYLDGPGRRAVILPALRPAAVHYNRLGASFTPPHLSASVAAGSPAARAGLREGDLLLAIDGLAPGDYAAGVKAPSIWMQPAGTPLVLTVRRGADRVEVAVRLEDWLGQAG
jgi:hypothetical protein